jgi:hypothetical protein
MADYVLVGHPLNVTDLRLEDAESEPLRNALRLGGVGDVVVTTLTDSSETKVTGILARSLFTADDLYPSDDLYPVA